MIKLQQEPPFNGQTNNFSGSGYQYSQGNMNGVSPLLYSAFQFLNCTTWDVYLMFSPMSSNTATQTGGELPSLPGAWQPNTSDDAG